MEEKKKRIDELVEIINKASYEYYLNDSPSITDQEYDDYYSELLRLEEAYPELKREDSPTIRVGGEALSKFEKVEHKTPMLSFDDIFNEDEIIAFDERIRKSINNPTYTVEPKMDGLSGSLIYEKGLQLYTNGVLIMDKCSELLPDYFSFVRGVIDTEDIPLNISRETLQDDKNIKLIAKSIESKVKNELLDLLKNNRDKYLEFYKAFGMQLKFGIYNDYGMHKDKLEDLIMFYSSGDKKLITLDEYVNKLKEEDKNIYYCAGETVDKIDMLPQVEGIKDKHEVLYLTDYIDEFAIMAIHEYKGKTFVNVTNESTDLSTDEEKEKINKENTDNKDMLEEMKKVLEGNVEEVKLTNKLKSHPVCLTTTGEVSTSMEKVINAMPTDEKIKANEVLEINASHKIVDKLKDLYKNDKDEFTKYTKVIYYEARLIEGLPIDNPTELSNLMCDIMANK